MLDEWIVWRLALDERVHAGPEEIRETWTYVDVMKCHAYLDAIDAAQAVET